MRNMKLVWFLISYFAFHICHAQQNNGSTSLTTRIDSLLQVLKTAKEDTNKVNTLNELGWDLKQNNPDTAIYFSLQALTLAQKINYKKGEANAFSNIGVGNYLKGDYPQALDNYLKALKIDEAINDKPGISKRFGNIGLVYMRQANYPKALDYYFKSLKIKEELGDKKGIANTLGNIGIFYREQADYPKALGFYLRALQIDKELGDKNGIAIKLGNIGLVYMYQANSKVYHAERDSLYKLALDYYLKALKIDEELGNVNGIARHLSNIGLVYEKQVDYPKALDNYFKALKMAQGLGYKELEGNILGNIGFLNAKIGKYMESEEYLLKALSTHRGIGSQNGERQVEEALTELYEKTNRHKEALEHYKRAMVLKDSLFSEEKNKELVQKEMNYDFEKKEAATKAEQDKKDTVTQIIIYSVSIGFALVLILAVFIFRGYRQKQKANIIISEQKLLVEEKQKDILDSIHYAKRIQQSLLPTEKYIQRKLNELKNKI